MRPGSLIGPIVIAIGIVAAALTFAIVSTLLGDADGRIGARIDRLEERITAQQAEIRALRTDLGAAEAEMQRLRETLDRRALALPQAPADPAPDALTTGADFGDHLETEAPTEVMQLARKSFNQGITQPGSRFMMQTLGPPREDFSQTCQAVTNPRLAAAMDTRQIGPVRVTMLRPALDSLERIMTRLRETEPDIHAKIGTAGAICARFIRGSSSAVSNHSWGTAIDLTVEGVLDGFADGGTQFGLLIIAEYFNDEGWFWGATYGREDSMHFEVGAEQIQAWVSDGLI